MIERQGSDHGEQSGERKEIDVSDLRHSAADAQGHSGDRDQAEPHDVPLRKAGPGGHGAGNARVSVDAEA